MQPLVMLAPFLAVASTKPVLAAEASCTARSCEHTLLQAWLSQSSSMAASVGNTAQSDRKHAALVSNGDLHRNEEGKASFLTLGAGGDFMPNTPMMSSAFASSSGYQSLWLDDMEALMHLPDFLLANHETVAAECVDKDWNDVGKPCPMTAGDVYKFAKWSVNNHPRLAADMVALGIDVVTLANNHIMDRGPLGLERTIDALDAVGLHHMGARRQSNASWYSMTTAKGWTVAWVGCAEHMTDERARGSDQVLYCSEESDLIPLIEELSSKPEVDAVVVALHWGKIHKVDVYQTDITSTMRDFARRLIDAGASAVIGAHPHVLMSWENYNVGDRNGLILYSLGNMVAEQGYSRFSLQRCQEMHGHHKAYCQRILLGKVLAYFRLVPHASGKASADKLSYACTTWSGPRGGMVLLEEQLCKKGYASEALAGAARLPGLRAKYKRTKSNRDCDASDRKDLPHVESVEECMVNVDADPQCGPQFTTNGTECRCMLLGNHCKEQMSSRGNNLYELMPVPAGQWVLAQENTDCSSSDRKSLPLVSSMEECQSIAERDPDCGDVVIGDGSQCECVYYGETCQMRDSSDGINVYKWQADDEKEWRPTRSNMRCGSNGRKSLPDVESVEECRQAVDSDSDCGGTFTSNGRKCQCILQGESCEYKASPGGQVVFKKLGHISHIVDALHWGFF